MPTDLDGYAQALAEDREPAATLESFDRDEAMSETLYLGLRTRQGVSDTVFRESFGCGVAEAYPTAVEKLSPWLEHRGGHWRLTVDGWLLYDRLVQEFL